MEDGSSNQALEDDILRASMFLTLSKAFQRTAYHLNSQFSEPVIEDQSKIFAFGVSMVVLRVFAVELAIKALIAHVVREKPEPTHTLMRLFNKLPGHVRNSANSRFQRMRRTKASYQGQTDRLADVLLSYENAFMEWRYLDNVQRGLHSNPNVLNSVLEALWEEYESHARA